MLDRLSSFRLLGSLVLIIVALLAALPPRAVIGVPAPPPRSPSALLFIPKMPTRAQTAYYRRYQVMALRSCGVEALRLLKTADQPSLKTQDDPAGWLRQNLKAEYLDGTGVLRISFMAGSRREQALVVNAFAQSFLKIEVRRQLRTAKKLCEWLREDLKDSQEWLEANGARPDKQRTKQGIENDISETKRQLQYLEGELRTPPLLLELAEMPRE